MSYLEMSCLKFNIAWSQEASFEVCIWKQCVTVPPDPEVLLNNEKYEGVFRFINRKDVRSP